MPTIAAARHAILAAIVIMLLAVPAARAAECQAMLDEFNRTVDNGREQEAQGLVDKIAISAECGKFQVPVQRRMAALRLGAAQLLMARGRPVSDFERLLGAAEAPEVLWEASATVGEVRFGERRFAEAAQAYDRAIEIIKNETLTPAVPSKFAIESLITRSAQARLLAANGGSDGHGKHVRTARDQRDGTIGGFYSRSVRGIAPRALPVPITFDYGKTTFTLVGQEAVRELATVLKEQRPTKITLVGHTDVRGTPEYNLKLSRDRAAAVASYLGEKGVAVVVNTAGKGSNEPLRLLDSSGLSQEDIYALNRRVEWQRD